MACNVGTTDKVIRIVLSVILIAVGLALQSQAGILALIVPVVIAGILIVTAFTGFCPIYRVLGLSTCQTQS